MDIIVMSTHDLWKEIVLDQEKRKGNYISQERPSELDSLIKLGKLH